MRSIDVKGVIRKSEKGMKYRVFNDCDIENIQRVINEILIREHVNNPLNTRVELTLWKPIG